MRITSVDPFIVRAPTEGREGPTTGDWTVVLVHTDTGLTGIGRGGSIEIISQELVPVLVGQDPRRIALLWEQMYETAWRFGGPGRAAMPSVGALDVALWDIYGKACGQPVWRLLGGYRDKVRAYADGSGYVAEADQSSEAIAALVKKHADLGYDAMKIHMYEARSPEEIVERVRCARELIGMEKKLMVDLHRAWEGKTAVEIARQLEPYNLYWIEEPVRSDDEATYLRMVQDATSAIVAGGESEGTLYGIRQFITEGALQLIQTDILIGGGFTGLMRIAALCHAYHLPVAPHGAQFPDINCHLAAAVPNGLIVSAYPDCEPNEIWSKLYDPPFQIIDGHITMTEQPGLGLTLNEDFIDRYQLRTSSEAN